MSLSEEKEDEDIASKMSSSSPETSCDQPMKNLPSASSAMTSDPRIYLTCTASSEAGDLQKPVDNVLQRVKDQHKTSMKNKYERLIEGTKLQENASLLNSIYT
ncbi:hypothetical protein cypCar_00046907 [Cyprinus carpio]|nr:hypothetical protein cypCar_00046907 [Cyprinus carpio]